MSPPRNASSAWSAALRLVALVVMSGLATTRCASGACDLNSDCNAGTYCGYDHQCRYDCFEDRDCADGSFCNRDRGRCQSLSGDAGVTADAGKKKDAGEVPVDAGGHDAGFDVGVDAGFDVGVDVGFDVGSPPADVGVPPTDVGFPPADVGFPATDVGFPPVDVGNPRRAYLDPCTTGADCVSGECYESSIGARFCTRRCGSSTDCGQGFLCSSLPAGATARCVPDDTGTTCDARTMVPCARYCVGNPVNGGMAHCTHECRNATECPAGYACQDAGGGTKVCISAEQPCEHEIDCTTNLCVGLGSFQGCTSRCTSDSDCPRRMTVDVDGIRFTLPPYRCQLNAGVRLCVPPLEANGGDIAGSNELGAPCGTGASPLCRSGVCDSVTNVCVQGCTPVGGCPSGFVCRPWLDDGDVYLVCRRSVIGAATLGTSCMIGADCTSGLCLGTSSAPGAPAYCTRFCNDRLCPTGTHCMEIGSSFDGTMLSFCQP
ncbi:MAG: hypothetical protein JWM10_1587 [Myxococcaceae bacterium]|nr:hypothetical protein [Myxococcaceae bacterium]